MNFKAIIIISIFILLSFHTLQAEDDLILSPYKRHAVRIMSENDAFSFKPTDGYYTNGMSISYFSKEYNFYKEESSFTKHFNWARFVSLAFLVSKKEHLTRFSVSLSHEMRTSMKNIDSEPYPYPFSGYLYTNFAIMQRSENIFERISIDIGLIGPYAFGEAMQHAFHSSLGQGSYSWKYEIQNEPIVNIHYEILHKWLLLNAKYFNIDTMLGGDIVLGNGDIHAGFIATLRMGYNLSADFLPPVLNKNISGAPAHSDKPFIYLFVTGGLRLNGINIFVQGNSGKKNPYFDYDNIRFKERYDLAYGLFSVQTGIVAGIRGFRAGYVWTFHTREYEKQANNHSFGTIFIEGSF